MTTWRGSKRAGGVAMAALLFLAEVGAAGAQIQEVIRGTWRGRFEGDGRGWVQLQRDGERGSLSLPERVAVELEAAGRASSQARLELAREAGRLSLEGTVGDTRGRGVFTFAPDPAYAPAMARLGLGRLDGEDLLAAAIWDVGSERLRMLERAGYRGLEFDELLSSAIFQVDTTFIAAIRALGFQDLDIDQLVAFKIHGVTPEFIVEARAMGLGALDADDLVAMRIHEVGQEQVDAARSLGGQPDLDDVLGMAIHGVTAEFIQQMTDAGVRPEDVEEALAFRIHGVTPELVRSLRDQGFTDLDGEDLLKIRIHGLDRMLRRGGGG